MSAKEGGRAGRARSFADSRQTGPLFSRKLEMIAVESHSLDDARTKTWTYFAMEVVISDY